MRRILLITILITSAVTAFCLGDKTAYYQPYTFEYEGITLPYRQLELNQDKDGKSLLVVQLHGGTARGDNNTSQLEASAVDSVETYLRVHRSKAYFLLPQCGADRVWNESRKSYEVVMTDVLRAWLDDFIATHDIDFTRIYITGYSAGGSGSWRMVNDNPGLFAAAAIAAANPIMVTAQEVKATPVYAIAGSNDRFMDASKIETFVNSLITLGGDAKFDLLDGKDHFGTCDEAFTKDRLDWIFGHRITVTGDVNSDGSVNAGDVSAVYNVMLGSETDADVMRRTDVNNDGSVNAGDVSAVYNVMLQ